MTDLLLAEEFFLLGHDDESGKNRVAMGLTGGLSGALLLDLALRDLIDIEARDTVVPAEGHPEHPVLAEALAAIRAEGKTRSVGSWISVLPSRIRHLDTVVGRSLADRGILSEEHATVLGLFGSTRWPERDPGPEKSLRARLAQVLVTGTDPSESDLALIAMLDSYGMIRGLVDKADRGRARGVARDLRKRAERGDAVSKAVGRAVRATQAAVLASIAASSAAASTAATTAAG